MKNNRINNRKMHQLVVVLLAVVVTGMPTFGMTRIQDIARPLGERSNKLVGLGLVMGLKNGDGGDVLITARPLFTMLQKMGNPPGSLEELKNAKNVALVMVTAELSSSGVRNGDKVDVVVSTIGKASSLAGGMLMPTALQSINSQDEMVYAWAEGPISIPDQEYETTGAVKGGAIIEVGLEYDYIDYDPEGRSYFDLILYDDQAGWQTANTIAMTIEDINTAPGADESISETAVASQSYAEVLGPRTIRVFIPPKRMRDYASYIGQVLDHIIDLPNVLN